MSDLRKRQHDEIAQILDEDPTPEIKEADDNLDFEKEIVEDPIPSGIGEVNVFNCETWDVNMMLKGNYWGRTIYTTDKICKLFLKWNLERQLKYLKKKNPMSFEWKWLLLLIAGGVGALILIILLLPQLGV